uniref:Uncharacterized protein LOC117357290 n=1 Tax=Geotrypetes seraphini TaxID=260995 RepID=A0A6P8QB14_GEOSA|nr:uncharacterized protein LOC117357290 [Geotrypetes seraphini]
MYTELHWKPMQLLQYEGYCDRNHANPTRNRERVPINPIKNPVTRYRKHPGQFRNLVHSFRKEPVPLRVSRAQDDIENAGPFKSLSISARRGRGWLPMLPFTELSSSEKGEKQLEQAAERKLRRKPVLPAKPGPAQGNFSEDWEMEELEDIHIKPVSEAQPEDYDMECQEDYALPDWGEQQMDFPFEVVPACWADWTGVLFGSAPVVPAWHLPEEEVCKSPLP